MRSGSKRHTHDPASHSIICSIDLYFVPSGELNTRVNVAAFVLVKFMLVELSIFKHWVSANPMYVTVPLVVDRFPAIVAAVQAGGGSPGVGLVPGSAPGSVPGSVPGSLPGSEVEFPRQDEQSDNYNGL